MMIRGEQIKAARMLLNSGISTLARSASVQGERLLAIEAAGEASSECHILINEALEAGVEFRNRDTAKLKSDIAKRAGQNGR
jgi:hypothetical protein